MHCAAGTRHVAVTTTAEGVEPHDSPGGVVEIINFEGLLLLARNWTNPAAGLHVTKSGKLPVPTVAEKEMTSGFTAQVALGVVGVAVCRTTEV
jgi:hypothetical protein